MQVHELDDVLRYLHSVLEGRNHLHLNRWLRLNAEPLRTLFSRPELARLKFDSIEFARKLLAKHSLAYAENTERTRRETYLLSMSDEFLDETGELRADYYQRIFDGLLCDFLAGVERGGRQRIAQYLHEHQREDQPLLAEPVADLLFFAERELEFQPELSRAIVLVMKEYFDRQEISMQEVDRVVAQLG